jgi:hypothetical protein
MYYSTQISKTAKTTKIAKTANFTLIKYVQ